MSGTNLCDVEVGVQHTPKIIAELSGNHNGSLERALRIVDAAYKCGAHFIKLQTYTPDTITLNSNKSDFVIDDPKSVWHGRTFHSLYSEAYTPWEWQTEIFSHAKALGIPCFSAVFDETSVEFLEDLGVGLYKTASQECVHIPLIQEIARTGKPLILSTGMATISEIEKAVNAFVKISSAPFVLLKCTSTYPADPLDSNILTIPVLRSVFACEVGLSDHTMGIGAALAAVSHGASLVEKHLTLSRSDGGIDSAFSLEPDEFKNLVREADVAWRALGKIHFGPTSAEIASLSGRRSIYVSNSVKKGNIFTKDNVKIVRPNGGIAPEYWEVILGRAATCDIEPGVALQWSMVGG